LKLVRINSFLLNSTGTPRKRNLPGPRSQLKAVARPPVAKRVAALVISIRAEMASFMGNVASVANQDTTRATASKTRSPTAS